MNGASGDDRRDLIEGYLAYYTDVRDKIVRQMLLALHSRGYVSVDEIYLEARERLDERRAPDESTTREAPDHDDEEDTAERLAEEGDHPGMNRGMAHRWDADERREIDDLVIRNAAIYFTAGELDALVLLTRKRNEAQHLTHFANDLDLPIDQLAQRLDEYCNLPGRWVRLPKAEATGLRVAIIRRFISEHLDFVGVAKQYLTLRDLNGLMAQSVGTTSGAGRLGGKAAGMVLASCILRDAMMHGEEAYGPFKTPESIFLRTELFVEFLRHNGLMEYTDQKYKDIEEIKAEFSAVREVFKNAEFPEEVTQKLREVLEAWGEHPLIVRSSSLLEDNFNYAFSGKYASIFLGNQGPIESRLNQLLGAIAEVYASTLGPDPISYRRTRNLIDYDEMMGIIIQKVVGRKQGRFFFPAWAGVAFSHNEYRWNKRIKKEDGLARIVMGLGSRAVDRVGGDYPRMVALGVPTLRPEGNVQDACRYSQRFVDVMDLKRNEFRSVPLARLLEEGPIPQLDQIVSIFRDGDLTPPVSRRIREPAENLVVTFDKLVSQGDFVPKMRWILSTIEKAYGRAVDVEFAHDGTDFYILQCRPLSSRIEMPNVTIPSDIPPESVVFTADREVSSAVIEDIEVIVYVDPVAYDAIESNAHRNVIAAVVGRLNAKLEGRKFVLMGPGRWGSSDIRLGVRCTYADICNTCLLVEVARSRGEYEPDVSFGTHFFQDLVESGIHHLPLYPDSTGVVFSDHFLTRSPNALGDLLPEYRAQAEIVHVIDVPEVTGGRHLRVVMDGRAERAIGYLA
jgi:hypothetical protein